MRNVAKSALARALIISTIVCAWGCHADPDDPAGQAEELKDPVRRENALRNIQRLYSGALAATENNRGSDKVMAVVNATIEKIAVAYLEYPEDTQNGRMMLDILKDMQDARGLPAFKEALGWRPEVTEEHAITAAQSMRAIEIPDGDIATVIEKLAEALDRVSGARAVDNRMRIEFIRTLGSLADTRATAILTKIATTQSEEQNFLINRLAATQIGQMGDPAAVPDLIKCLFLFAPNNPAMRMNDVAAEALVRIGRPSYEPLVALMRGQNDEVRAIVDAYIEAVRVRDEAAAEQMSAEMLINSEATFTLGALGFSDAFDAIVAEAQSENIHRRINGSIALVRLSLDDARHARVVEILKSTYEAAELQAKPQLLAAMRMTYDAALLPFFLAQAADQEVHPQVRLEAFKAYALLANAADAGPLRDLIRSEPASEDGGYRENFQTNEPLLALAADCNDEVSCWIGKLDNDDKEIVKKAAYMLGRYGRGNEEAIAALVGLLDHDELEVRLSALSALDHTALAGSQAAIDKIDELREAEEGRSIWNNFRREALPTQARLRNRLAD